MNDFTDRYAPTPEFRASLEREITRALRAERQFEVPRDSRARRVGMVIGLALGAVVTLTIGLVLGASTGYASAEVVLKEHGDTAAPHRPALAMIPIRGALSALGCSAPTSTAVIAPKPASAQPGIRLVDLPAATTRAGETFGAILGIRQSADGRVLVNDAGRRQLKLFDSTLAVGTVVLDSAPGSSNSYGPRGAPLIPFVGDSSLFVDWNAQTLIVLDSRGLVARGLALPSGREFRSLTVAGGTGVDAKGRIVFRGMRESRHGSGPTGLEYTDSISIVRADLDLRRVDTIGRVARPLMKVTTEKYSDGSSGTVYAVDPLQPGDDWAVLSNGAIAVVRGHDYHIDWIQSDGTIASSTKLPFDWKRLTEDDKQRLADSLRAAQNALLALGYPQAEVRLRAPVPCDGGRGAGDAGGGAGVSGRSGGSGAPPPSSADCTQMVSGGLLGPRGTMPALPPFVDLTRDGPIADYDPPLVAGATMPDRDGNLWILPRKTKLARHGELVYDVVNAKGELFERVRLPEGRAIAGFGKGGVVYLTSGDRASGFHLERTTLPRAPAPRR